MQNFGFCIKKNVPLAHSRAEARLPWQPSTTAPSAHLCKPCLLLWNREFYRNFLFHKKRARFSENQALSSCRQPESNRYGRLVPQDFKSCASASSAMPAYALAVQTTRMGLEPTTSAVTGRRSNQLSHRAI